MLQRLNPHVKVISHEVALSSQNALDLFRGYDVVVDGTDNFPTRYLVNDACVLLGIPNAYGSIFRFEGQASVFATKDGPCYRCLYPEPPPPGLVPELRRGRRARHPARPGRHHPGDRDGEADPRHRPDAGRPLPHLRRDADALPRADAAQGSRLPGVRHAPDGDRAHRLRPVLRHRAGAGRAGADLVGHRHHAARAEGADGRRDTPRSSSTCASRTNTRSTASPARC